MKLRAKLIKPYHSLQLYEYYEICWNERNSFIKNAGGDHGIYTCDIVKYFDEITHVQEDPYKELKEAYERGEHIEIYKTDNRWHSIKYPRWDADASKYRVKPPPVYVPFGLSDDIVGRVVVRKNDGTKRIIIEQCSGQNEIFAGTGYLTYASLLSDYVFADGTLCGKLKEIQQ